jgi:dTDP-4-amino-4,6-dideoxygalactose transaminase
VARRRELVAAIRERIEGLPGVAVPDLVSGAEPSYWYWRVGVDETERTCGKATFCEALRAEGLLLTPRYDSRPHRDPWFRKQRVFGETGGPWQAPEYEGPADPEPRCPNAEVADVAAAFEKVATAYAR